MTRTALTYAKTLDENMTEQAVDIGITTLFSDRQQYYFDQLGCTDTFRSKLRSEDAFLVQKKLGAESIWNREVYSVGTPSGHKRSKVGFIVVGIFCLLAGFISLCLSLIRYIRSRKWSH